MRILIALITILCFTGGLTGCSRDGTDATSSDPESGADREESGRKVAYWKSAMDPSFVSQSPGKDRMGMDLVAVYEGDEPAGAPGTIRIDPATVQNIGVKTIAVERKVLSREIRTLGRVAYDETKVRWVSPKIGGWIERELVNYAGQIVKQGEPLLEIYSPELVSTQEEYLVALRYRERLLESSVAGAKSNSEGLVRDVESRLRFWNITPTQIEALRERGEITRTMKLFAPFDGIVVEKRVPEGGYIQAGQAVYEIADISKVWVYADIYEYEAPWIELGQKVTMTLAYDPSMVHTGKVDFIYPYIKSKTRTLQVRMQLENSEDFDMKPDMWANVVLHSIVAHDALAVPVQSVIRTGKRDVVLISLGDGRFEPRQLEIGVQAGDDFQVLSGKLDVGEQVVTSAQFLINSESNLQAAVARMIESTSTRSDAGERPSPTSATGSMQGMKMDSTSGAGSERIGNARPKEQNRNSVGQE